MSTTNGRGLEQELEFRRRRKGVLGGSDAPVLFGFHPKKDALSLYHEKTRPVREEDVRRDLEAGSIDLHRGRVLEPVAAEEFWEHTGYEGRHETRQITHPDHDVLAVHVDGTIYADEDREPPKDRTGVLELKAPRGQTFQRIVERGVDRRYIVQLQYNLAVTGRAWGCFGFYSLEHSAGPIVVAETVADEEFGRLLVERGREFMEEHVQRRVPPDPDEWDVTEEEGTAEALEDRSGEYELVEDEEFLERVAEPVVDRYELKREATEQYDALREEARAWIEDHLGTDAVRLPSGDKLRIIRQEGRTYLNEKALREHRPIDRDAFVRYMTEVRELPEQDAEGLADELELDLSRLESTGDPSAYLRIYPAN